MVKCEHKEFISVLQVFGSEPSRGLSVCKACGSHCIGPIYGVDNWLAPTMYTEKEELIPWPEWLPYVTRFYIVNTKEGWNVGSSGRRDISGDSWSYGPGTFERYEKDGKFYAQKVSE